MKRFFKSAAIIFSAVVMTFMSMVSASAERRAVFNDADRDYWDYLNRLESEIDAVIASGKYRNTYDWNMDNEIDVIDAQLSLNDYVRFIALGPVDDFPQNLYDKYTEWCTKYRHSKPLTDPKDSLVCAQATLEYYTAFMTGNAYYTVWEYKYWDPNTGEYVPTNPQHARINYSANGFFDWLMESTYYKNWKLRNRK